MKAKHYTSIDLDFKKAAIYKIVVQGEIEPDWSDTIWGLQVDVLKQKGMKSITSLIGRINDQSALSGILTMLNDMHMIVVSVNMLSEVEKNINEII